MTKMCVNTPIAVENIPPENVSALEKFGLFYPKIPQKLMSKLLPENLQIFAENLVDKWIEFLNEWNFQNVASQPLQTLKSFIIFFTGCETAQRVNENEIVFLVMDAGKIWDKGKLKKILDYSIKYISKLVNIKHVVKVDFIDIFGNTESGRYFCEKCGMFFEFGIKKDRVTCPLMAQKCMFNPVNIEKVTISVDILEKQYQITPNLYKKFFSLLDEKKSDFHKALEEVLLEWNITEVSNKLYSIFFE